MDDKARRNLGAHYTSEENILKLIKPLFLDGLRAEFEKIKGNRNKLFEFHKKLRGLTFFDPACGCGNFLAITYRELRLLELDVLRAAHSGRRPADARHSPAWSPSTSTSSTASRSRNSRRRSPRSRCGWSTTR
jgi:hypothetical protein